MRLRRGRGAGCGGLVGLLLLAAAGAWIGLYPFLARQAPVPSDLLVVEGWMSDDLLVQAAGWAESNGVKRICATGGPIGLGSHLSEWKTYAEMTRARMEKLGLGKKFTLMAAPAESVRRDRTRESARALKSAMGMERGSFNLASEGPHARRSWRVFQRVFGEGVAVGSVALTPVEYGAGDWWSCSEGVRSMVGETVAYLYDCLPGRSDGP